MSEKTDAKKQLIFDKALEVFDQKGYRTVTMSDIQEACQISRGSLYSYFSSVEEIFAGLLEKVENTGAEQEFDWESDAVDLLLWFVKEMKLEILKKKNLLMAKIEYSFEKKCKEGKDEVFFQDFEKTSTILESILVKGNKSGEFDCQNPKATATNMMYAFHGMRLTAAAYGITEKQIDKQLVFMLGEFMDVEE